MRGFLKESASKVGYKFHLYWLGCLPSFEKSGLGVDKDIIFGGKAVFIDLPPLGIPLNFI